jgi:hypothetical protein
MTHRVPIVSALFALLGSAIAVPAGAKVCSLWPSPTTGYENSYLRLTESGGQSRQSPSNYMDPAQYNAELFFTERLSEPAGNGSAATYYADKMGIMEAQSTWKEYEFGWENWGDPNKAMARTLNAFEVVWNSYTPAPRNWEDRSGPPIKWGLGWIARVFNDVNDLRGGCHQTKVAYSQWDFIGIGDEYTVLYPLFFFRKNAIQRASTLFHESFHKRWSEEHSAEDAEKAWAYNDGMLTIYAWQASYLMSYYYDANANTYTTYRRWAQYAARDTIATRFIDLSSIPDDIKLF